MSQETKGIYLYATEQVMRLHPEVEVKTLRKCKVFYIGRTKRCLQDRLAEHKYAIRFVTAQQMAMSYSI
ncbi:hypothetical protein J4Q44_G00158340 [Coregonus suidteri]|uniref:Uncharacterized protein n=1 Tax=Coregonus suidteri TaxID=861788 RepID=A0AAN8QS87_9TELE